MRTLCLALLIATFTACQMGVDKNPSTPDPAVGRSSSADTSGASSTNRLPSDSNGRPAYSADTTKR